MTKIQIKQSVAGHGSPDRTGSQTFAFAEGQVVEIEDELATAWIQSGIAARAPKVAPKAEFAVAKKSETPKAVAVEDSSKKEG
jgi:hypothetical protein